MHRLPLLLLLAASACAPAAPSVVELPMPAAGPVAPPLAIPQVPPLPDDPPVAAEQVFAPNAEERFRFRAHIRWPELRTLARQVDARAVPGPDSPDGTWLGPVVVVERHPGEVRVVNDQIGVRLAMYMPLAGLSLAATSTAPLRSKPLASLGFNGVEVHAGFYAPRLRTHHGLHLLRSDSDFTFEGWIEADKLGWVFEPRPPRPDAPALSHGLAPNTIVYDRPSGEPIARVAAGALPGVRLGQERGGFVEVFYDGDECSLRGWVQAGAVGTENHRWGRGKGLSWGQGLGSSVQTLLVGTPLHLAAPDGELGPQVGLMLEEKRVPKLGAHGKHVLVEVNVPAWRNFTVVAPAAHVERASVVLAERARRRQRVTVQAVQVATAELLRELSRDEVKDALVACADASPAGTASTQRTKAPAKPTPREVDVTLSWTDGKVTSVTFGSKASPAEIEFRRCVTATWLGRFAGIAGFADQTTIVWLRVDPP